MVDTQIICNIESREGSMPLATVRIINDDGMKNAEDIIDKFKNDKYIIARIDQETIGKKENGKILVLRAKYPIITVDCSAKGGMFSPARYGLERIRYKKYDHYPKWPQKNINTIHKR